MSTAKKVALTALFTVLLVVNSFALVPPKKAESFDIVKDIWALVKNTAIAANTAVSAAASQALVLKETTLDPLAFSIAKKMLQQMVYSIIDWINSGFDGSPAFITDYKQFFLDAADKALGQFLEQELGFLCEPFQFDIKAVLTIQLMKQRDYRERSTCSLSGAASNVQDFVDGNFSNGGWGRWLEITTRPENNFIGQIGMGQEEMDRLEEEAKDAARTEALAGNGMKSATLCFKTSSGSEYCPITTPGIAIADQLTRALGASEDTLISADEINEVISALFNQLAIQAITGVNGLLGLSYQGDDGSPSYLSQFQDDIDNPTTGPGSSDRFITDAIAIEERYRAMHVEIQDMADDIAAQAADATCSAADNILNRADKIATDMDTDIARAEENIAALEELRTIFRDAPADVKISIADEFQRMLANGEMPNESDLQLRQLDLDNIKDTLDGYQSTLDSCN